MVLGLSSLPGNFATAFGSQGFGTGFAIVSFPANVGLLGLADQNIAAVYGIAHYIAKVLYPKSHRLSFMRVR